MKSICALERRDSIGKSAPTRGQPMTLWDMAMTVREFAKKRPITFARLPIGWPGEAYEFDGPLSFMGNDGGGAVGTGPGHTIGAALALKGQRIGSPSASSATAIISWA